MGSLGGMQGIHLQENISVSCYKKLVQIVRKGMERKKQKSKLLQILEL